jgi:hypothetical protein
VWVGGEDEGLYPVGGKREAVSETVLWEAVLWQVDGEPAASSGLGESDVDTRKVVGWVP